MTPATTVGWIARILVGGLFVVSAIGKIADVPQFVKEVRGYELAPFGLTNAIANLLPWIELYAGALLIVGFWRCEMRRLILLMLVIFTIAKGIALARGLEIECGCGGQFAFLKPIFALPQGILTNLVLIGLLGVDAWAQRAGRGARLMRSEDPADISAPAHPRR